MIKIGQNSKVESTLWLDSSGQDETNLRHDYEVTFLMSYAHKSDLNRGQIMAPKKELVYYAKWKMIF